jgi:hypothetical protein
MPADPLRLGTTPLVVDPSMGPSFDPSSLSQQAT